MAQQQLSMFLSICLSIVIIYGLCVRQCLYSSNFPVNDLSVCLPSALWKNGRSHPAAVWHPRLDGSRDESGIGVWQSVHGKGYFWGVNLDRTIVTNGDFTAYV